MSKKQDLARYRNNAIFRIVGMQGNVQNILHSLPDDSKGLTQKELDHLLEVRDHLSALNSIWRSNTKILINNIKDNE